MEYSNLFVVLMGMSVVFFGLICIIVLTTLMGMILQPKDTGKQEETPAKEPEEEYAEESEETFGIHREILAVILTVLSWETGTSSSKLSIVNIKRI